jgi:hypothetical protein
VLKENGPARKEIGPPENATEGLGGRPSHLNERGAVTSFSLSQTVKRGPCYTTKRETSSKILNFKAIRRRRVIFQKTCELVYKCWETREYQLNIKISRSLPPCLPYLSYWLVILGATTPGCCVLLQLPKDIYRIDSQRPHLRPYCIWYPLCAGRESYHAPLICWKYKKACVFGFVGESDGRGDRPTKRISTCTCVRTAL